MPPPYIDCVDIQFYTYERNIMEKLKPRTLSGFMELLPAPQTQMERMMAILR